MEKYEVKKVVGEGSFGKAILCKRKMDTKLCIIKQISMKKLSKKEALLTEQEATLLKRLQHPNIVTFWESFVSNSCLHIVMEFADGGDLDHYIKAHAKSVPRKEIPEKQVLHMFVQLSLAIKHIHDRKILHRDLKSQNVFLTSAGTLKLGDFGVSRVLRHTVELAATQIGTPYYMSPEIMENQRYNSKTDIWSLGCILYELMCLRLPFDGASMKQLCYNIIKVNPSSPSMSYSAELRELVRDTLHKNPKIRPGINSILSRPIMRSKISSLLGQTRQQAEFSHTVLHGANVLNSAPPPVPSAAPAPPPGPAPAARVITSAPAPPPRSAAPAPAPVVVPGRYSPYPQQQQPQQAPQPAAGHPSSAPAPNPYAPYAPSAPQVISSAAQAVAMLQQQRQQQLMRQAQNQAQQQQYVGAMAAQMKEQIEMARLAEAARVRASQQQAEEQQQRLKQAALAKAKEQQQRAVEMQKMAERQKAVDAMKRQQEQQQFEQLEKMKRAALAEQQRKLEQRRQERLDYEKAKEKEMEKLRAQAQRQQQLLQQQQARKVSASPVPSVAAAPTPAPTAAAGAPVRQFSAAALLARRRHSAPEQAPAVYLSRPSSANNLTPAPVPAAPKPPNPFHAIVGSANAKPQVHAKAEIGKQRLAVQNPARAPSPAPTPSHAQLQVQGQQARAPTKAPVPVQEKAAYIAAPQPARIATPVQQQPVAVNKGGTPRSAKREPWNDDVAVVSSPPEPIVKGSPLRLPSTPVSSDSPRSRVGADDSNQLRKLAAQNAIAQAQQVLQSVQGMQAKARNDRPLQDDARAALNTSASSDGSSSYGDILPDTPQQTGSAAHTSDNCDIDACRSEDEADDACAQLAPSAGPGPSGNLRLDAIGSSEGNADGEGGSGSPWLSDLMGQMGVLKNQMRNLQQLRSPALQPSQASSPGICQAGSSDSAADSQSSSPLSSITAASPAERFQQRSRNASSASSSRDPPGSNGGYQQKFRPPLANAGARQGPPSRGFGTPVDYGHDQEPQQSEQSSRSGKMSSQRMSFPLSNDAAQTNKLRQQQQIFTSADDASAGEGSQQDPLVQRKESRAKHNADFRAFVQAQRRRNGPSDGLEEDSVTSAYSAVSVDAEDSQGSNVAAAPALRIKVPVARANNDGGGDSSSNTPSSAVPAKAKAGAGKRASPAVSQQRPAAKNGSKGGAPSTGKPPSNRTPHGHTPTPSSAASSPHCSQYQQEAASPMTAGFNVEEFRSQRDAQRREMRLLMMQKKKELQHNAASSEDLLLQSSPDHIYDDHSISPAPAVAAKLTQEPAAAPTPSAQTARGAYYMRESTDSADADQSQLFAHLQDSHDHDHHFHHPHSAMRAAVPEFLGESFLQQVHPGAGAAAPLPSETSMMDYSVLIEQMQAILRIPPGSHKHHHSTPGPPPAPSSNSNLRTPASSNLKDTLPRRALLGELILEQSDEDEQSTEESAGAGSQGKQDQQSQQLDTVSDAAAEEDSDAFEEEDFPADLQLHVHLDQHQTLRLGQDLHTDNLYGNGENHDDSDCEAPEGYPNDYYQEGDDDDLVAEDDGLSKGLQPDAEAQVEVEVEGSAFNDDDGNGSETDEVDADGFPCAGAGAGNEVLHFAASADPFGQPMSPQSLMMMPSMHTADVMLLDPLRLVQQYHHQHHVHEQHRQHIHDTVQEEALFTPSKSAATAAAERERRLQVAELQEYLVAQLGSTKVNQALRLLSENTAATMGASPGEDERGESYYDEKDEELLVKIEEILGANALHYLDDMLMLLTLQS